MVSAPYPSRSGWQTIGADRCTLKSMSGYLVMGYLLLCNIFWIFRERAAFACFLLYTMMFALCARCFCSRYKMLSLYITFHRLGRTTKEKHNICLIKGEICYNVLCYALYGRPKLCVSPVDASFPYPQMDNISSSRVEFRYRETRIM